jgi:hypothetical protein
MSFTDPVTSEDSLDHMRETINRLQSLTENKSDRVTFASNTNLSIIDADVEVPLFMGVLEGAAPATDFSSPTDRVTWATALTGDHRRMEILVNITIGSSATLGPDNTFLKLEMLDSADDLVWEGRIHNPSGTAVAGTYCLRYYGNYFPLTDIWFRFTCSGDAQFNDVTLNSVAIEVRNGTT